MFFFPFRTDVPLRSIPWMNWMLIFLNIIVFILQHFVDPTWVAAGYLYPREPTLINFFTYAFLHANIGHIFGNMLFLYMFGNNVNDKLGNLGYLVFYLAGGVFAGVGYILTSSTGAPILGASGAIAAVVGAYLILFPISNVTFIYYIFIDWGTFDLSSIIFTIFFFVKELFFSFTGNSGVAHTAHVGGFIFGFVICLILLVVGLLPRDKFDILTLLNRWRRKHDYRALVRGGFNPWEHIRPEEPVPARGYVPPPPPDPATQRLLDLRGQVADAVTTHDLPRAAQLYLKLKQLDRNQVLSRQAQLDVANQLTSQQMYAEAADAYEQFLRCFPNYDQIEQVQLILGVVYARYLDQRARAGQLLRLALPRLRTERDVALANSELARIGDIKPAT